MKYKIQLTLALGMSSTYNLPSRNVSVFPFPFPKSGSSTVSMNFITRGNFTELLSCTLLAMVLAPMAAAALLALAACRGSIEVMVPSVDL